MNGFGDVAALDFGGLTVYVYGLYVSLGCLLAGGLLLFLCRGEEKTRNFAALSALFSPVLGLAAARLLWALTEVNFSPFLSIQNILNLRSGGFAMFGALIGAMLGGALAAKLARFPLGQALDRQFAALLLFVAVARLGEGHTALGFSRPLVTGVLDHTFLAFRDRYDAYLRTYLLEAAAAFLLCGLTLRSLRRRRPFGSLLMGLLAFGLSQNLFESLRADDHLRFSFIGLQQVLAVVLFSLVLIFLSIRLLRLGRSKPLAVLSLCVLPVALGALLGLEFMIDRSELSKWISYGLYALVLALLLGLGLRMINRGGYNGQGAG